MGDHSRNSRESRQMVPNKSISFSHLALIVILVIIVTAFPTHASPLEPYKRGRSSSLIPFPRVGRSVPEPLQIEDSENPVEDEEGMLRSTRSSKSQFYGQKRTASNDRVKRSLSSSLPVGQFPAAGDIEFKTLPYPRIGKRFSRLANNQYKREPTGMIPMARIGKRPMDFGPPVYSMFEKLQLDNQITNVEKEQPDHQSIKSHPDLKRPNYLSNLLMLPAFKRPMSFTLSGLLPRPELDHQMFKKSDWMWKEPIWNSQFDSIKPESQMFEMPRYGRSGTPADTMIPMARIGKRNDPTE